MRIAMFTDTYLPEINGVVTSVDLFRRELERQGHEVYLYAPGYGGRERPEQRVHRITAIPFPYRMMRERRLCLPGPATLRRFLGSGAEVIHSHIPGPVGVCGMVASLLFRIPHVHTYHTNYTEYTHYVPLPQDFARRLVARIARRWCGRCQRVIVPSEGVRASVVGYGVDAPVEVIPTGIDLRDAETCAGLGELLARYRLGPLERLTGKRLLVSVGRFGREKNLPFLVRAVAELRRRGRDVHLVVIGDGPDRQDLEREIVRLGVGEHVSLPGYMTRKDLMSFVRCCELFLFASKTETQGLVLLEAMAVGTPVVAIRATGVDELLGDDRGGIATEDRMESFADACCRLLDDPDFARIKRLEALETARLWSVEHQVRRLVSVYGDSIREKRLHGLPRYRHRHRY